jgi:ketosteroid isomerase-like protein
VAVKNQTHQEKSAEPTQASFDLINRLLDGVNRGDISVMDEVFHDDAVMEWPASREQVVGAENRRAVYGHMPTLPKVSNRHVFGSGDLWVAEATLTYGDKPYSAVLIFKLRDGKIAREIGYWAEPFEAPGWRAAWVAPLEPANRSD